MSTITLEQYRALLGKPVGTSRWFEVKQERIDGFADITEDWQFIHVDPVKAAESPFGGTIAHGMLTLSLLVPMAYDAVPSIEGRVMGVNYGFDKIRFISPVPAGARIRGHFVLQELLDRGPGQIQTRSQVTVEIEGQEKPALIAEWLGVSHFAV